MKRRTKKDNDREGPEHISRGPIFEDIGFTPEEAAIQIVKSQIYGLIVDHIRKKRYTRRHLEQLLDEPQPRISELMTGKISHTSIEKLLRFAARLGLQGELQFRHLRKAA
ncbi:MAG: XRE family transcriptional regulator [Pseudomonadota bacterium]